MKISRLVAMKCFPHLLTVWLIALTAVAGCSRKPALTVRAYIDGSDVVKVSGDRLWLEHDSAALPGKTIYVNDRVWTPAWSNNISSEFTGLIPVFKPRNPQSIQIAKITGRGIVSFQQFPSPDNGQTLAVRINDDEFGGADWYKITISW